ncbi:ubiquinol-cytochrome c reductase complex assembly factor 2 isoform 2-T2 [Mantella aurantiaca]
MAGGRDKARPGLGSLSKAAGGSGVPRRREYSITIDCNYCSLQIQDPEACDQMYESLNRINSNYYKEKYPRLQDTSFTEITAEEYRLVLATDSLKQLDEMKRGMWKRLVDKFNTKSPQDGAKE